MRLSINISPKAEKRLKKRAAAHGKKVAEYASQLVEEAATKPTLNELLEPLRKEYESSGVSEQELVEQITAAQKTYRKTRCVRQKPALFSMLSFLFRRSLAAGDLR